MASSARSPSFVSINPCTDAILVEVADPEQIRALSHYSRDPRASSIPIKTARKFATSGGTAEEVIALGPDIILASSFLQPSTRQAFANLDFDVATFGIASDVDSSFAQIRQIAALAGHAERGETLIEDIKAALGTNGAGANRMTLSAVLWQPGQIVPGEGVLIAQLMERAGFESQSNALGLEQADHLSLEQVLASPPQVLLVAGDARGQAHPALGNLDGTHIASFDPGLLYCAGPSIIRAMERLNAIHDGAMQALEAKPAHGGQAV